MDKQKCGDIPQLEDFHASPTFGFLQPNLAMDLPEYFKPWVDLAKQTEVLINNGEMREKIHKLPLLDHTILDSLSEWNAALLFLTSLTNAYVWCAGEEGIPEILPRNIAIPYAAVADHLQITPSMTSYSFILGNWKLKDPHGQMELDNLDTIIKLYGGADESWFFCVAVQVELDFVPALCSIIEAQKAVLENDVEHMIRELGTIDEALVKMKNSLNRMTERCNPWIFYNVFRPFLAGWDSPAFKKKNLRGLIYEGVSKDPVAYTGGSAAQSSTLPCLDAAFGVEHSQSEEKLCRSFQANMRKPHRDLIEAIRRGPSIRSFVHSCGSVEAVQIYNRCLLGMKSFRDCHLQIVARYIVAMSQRGDSGQSFKSLAAAGTGGTAFMRFLKGLRDSTIYTILGRDVNENMSTIDAASGATHNRIPPSNLQGNQGWKWKSNPQCSFVQC